MSLKDVPRTGTGEQRLFGDLLKQYRRAAGLTQEKLAEHAGLSVRGISNLERGVNRAPRPDTLQLLVAALTLSARERAQFESLALRMGSAGTPPNPRTTVQTGHGTVLGGSAAWQSDEGDNGSAVPPFVGRERELALLQLHLAGQGPPILLLAGQPGIGKSRLLQLGIDRAQAEGWRVLVGGCQRRGGQEPYAPLLQALERYIDGQSSLQLRAAFRGCAWLVRLLPELAAAPIEPLPPWHVSPEHEHRLMSRAVTRFLANVAGPAGTLLVLDDLQWAGADALELLTTLLRSSQVPPLRVLGAYRDTEVTPDQPLALMLADLAHADLLRQQPVGPLALSEARGLMEALLAGHSAIAREVGEQALQRTGGVPFFVVSWARGLEATGVEGQTALPWTLSQSIRQRVATLPLIAQDVLAAAAVLGRMASRSLLAGTCNLEQSDVVAGIEAACRAGLLAEEGETDYRFVHDVIREVIESDLGSARRAALHQRAGEALERIPGPGGVEARAYHFARGETQERALPYLEQAAERARVRHAYEAAAGYYRELIARLERTDRQRAVAVAREALGAVLTAAAQYVEALSELEQAASFYVATGELEERARVIAKIGRVHFDTWAVEEGVARVLPLLEPLRARGPSPGLAALYEMLTQLYNSLGRHREQLAASTQALECGRALRDDRFLTRVMHLQGNALIMARRVEESLRVLEEARRRAEAAGDLYSHRNALTASALGHYALGELEASGRCTDMALDIDRRLGDPTRIAFSTNERGRNAYLRGDWRRARADLERGLALSRQTGVNSAVLYAVVFLGELCLAEGAWDEASRYLHEALAVAGHNPAYGGRLRHAQILLAAYDLFTGHPEATRDRLLPLQFAEDPWGPWLQTHLAWAYLAMGDATLAASTVAPVVQQVRSEKHRIRLVDALHVQAMVFARQAQADQAATALDEALPLARAMPYPYGEARLLHVYGQLHAQQNEPERAQKRLEAALAIFQRLGARKDIEQVEQLLIVIGARG